MPAANHAVARQYRLSDRSHSDSERAGNARRVVKHRLHQIPDGLMPNGRRAIQARLRIWYHKHARDLPWRRTADAYKIWVSEVMLQQTQVGTVVPYYLNFIARFPSVVSLAAASQDEVLKAWQGLGYYRRAVNLHCAAREVVARHGGRVPAAAAALRQLPGIGRYIAGAIQSFAFNAPAPILEANSARVVCRLFAVPGRLGDSSTQRRLWGLSESLVPRRQPGLHNQALMELGALICVSRQPRCGQCPLAKCCAAQRDGLVDELPQLTPSRQRIDVHDACVVIRRSGRVLIVQRPTHGRWGGLWELPRTTVASGADPRLAVRSHVRETLGLQIDVGRKLLTLQHGVTHHRITLSCYASRRVAGSLLKTGQARFRWELPKRLSDYAFSSPQRKLIEAIQNSQGKGAET